MSDEIELASPAEVIALRLEWEKTQGQRSAPPQQVYDTEREREIRRESMNSKYERSEEERLAKIVARHKARKSKRAKRGASKATPKLRQTSKSDERWNEIYEKHKDKDYYGIRPDEQRKKA